MSLSLSPSQLQLWSFIILSFISAARTYMAVCPYTAHPAFHLRAGSGPQALQVYTARMLQTEHYPTAPEDILKSQPFLCYLFALAFITGKQTNKQIKPKNNSTRSHRRQPLPTNLLPHKHCLSFQNIVSREETCLPQRKSGGQRATFRKALFSRVVQLSPTEPTWWSIFQASTCFRDACYGFSAPKLALIPPCGLT